MLMLIAAADRAFGGDAAGAAGSCSSLMINLTAAVSAAQQLLLFNA
jgi:hypothetical protein